MFHEFSATADSLFWGSAFVRSADYILSLKPPLQQLPECLCYNHLHKHITISRINNKSPHMRTNCRFTMVTITKSDWQYSSGLSYKKIPFKTKTTTRFVFVCSNFPGTLKMGYGCQNWYMHMNVQSLTDVLRETRQNMEVIIAHNFKALIRQHQRKRQH